jgi:hypothetical protein
MSEAGIAGICTSRRAQPSSRLPLQRKTVSFSKSMSLEGSKLKTSFKRAPVYRMSKNINKIRFLDVLTSERFEASAQVRKDSSSFSS